MIESRPSRRALLAGGLAVATVSGCGTTVDVNHADRDLITQARNASQHLRDALGTSPLMTRLRVIHDQQIAEFDRNASSATPQPARQPVTDQDVRGHERVLARTLRTLSLRAQRGDVAALLASAAAGIEQQMMI